MTAPKLTEDDLLAQVSSESFVQFPGTTCTVCCLVMKNGFTVIGQSACINPENFDADQGRKLAREDAVRHLWRLEGYRRFEEMRSGG